MKVYHGSSVVVAKPDLSKSKVRIDFGPGFYMTTFRELLMFVRGYEVEAAYV